MNEVQNVKTNAQRFTELVPLFRSAIYDRIREKHGQLYAPTTANLREAAFAAMKEICESEVEPVSPMLAVNVWNAVMLTNESAFHQGMKREIEAGSLKGIAMVRAPRATAMQYCE